MDFFPYPTIFHGLHITGEKKMSDTSHHCDGQTTKFYRYNGSNGSEDELFSEIIQRYNDANFFIRLNEHVTDAQETFPMFFDLETLPNDDHGDALMKAIRLGMKSCIRSGIIIIVLSY